MSDYSCSVFQFASSNTKPGKNKASQTLYSYLFKYFVSLYYSVIFSLWPSILKVLDFAECNKNKIRIL